MLSRPCIFRKQFGMALCLLVFLLPSRGFTLELGLTPSNVYSLWLNINKVILADASQAGVDPLVVKQLEEMKPAFFDGKRPADVFALATRFHDVAVKTYELDELPPVPQWIEIYAHLIEDPSARNPETTPSQVYLFSSRILGSLVAHYVDETSGTLPVARFFSENDIQGKVPSDVFGMVDLALRRVEAIMEHSAGELH